MKKDEIFYHVFQRSFYDANGDGHGDLQGLRSKLDYIEELGVTSILLLPLYDSSFYHNYFANDFRKIDPVYGTFDDYIELIDDIHRRGMKLYLDMEVQYVAEDHLWFKDSYGNPASIYSQHIIYNDDQNTKPESIIFNLTSIHSYDGTEKKVACLNILNPPTQELIYKEFEFWTDPYGDGSLRSGVDGFRLDHMMDDLDDKGTITHVYSKLWKPLIDKVKSINPAVKFIGEQADWDSHGSKGFTEANVDYMFAFPLKFAISNQHKGDIEWAQLKGIEITPEDKMQIIMIENHDTNRYATDVASHPGRLRTGAALNILLKGIPAIYYGQELGMKGAGGFQAYGVSDGNDIPRREALPWWAKVEGPGICLWYKETGPWWDDSNLSDYDGISVEEQLLDPNSLLNFYKEIIKIRNQHEAFQNGEIVFLDNENDYVISYIRFFKEDYFLVNISLSDEKQLINIGQFNIKESIFSYPYKEENPSILQPFSIQIYSLFNEKKEYDIEH
ncbi:alpha-amylase family glycosyl hydrolase [Portibacter lacus]|uniref:Alpha-amylase n=1 Tax=Portibacter lacus TaxID=1099794 RepID=A0AA37SKR2_9BACT|nr:alpha-amylase family glycosyl hydrolase [Portibacter lacus]GLR15670.1 alpha-amylase [Portibacter lacus]